MKTLTFLILCFASLVLGDDFKTVNGKEYKNVKVSRVEPDGIVVITKSGISKIYFTELSKDVQERFGYDAEKAAAYYAEHTANAEAFSKQQAEAQQKQLEERAKYWSEHSTPEPQRHSAGSTGSAQDHWDSIFHPGALQRRQEQRYLEWVNSWKDRECEVADVKQFWLMTLTQIVPERLDPRYYQILAQNAELEKNVQSTLYDFDAQDIADQINIKRLKAAGQGADATALERLRTERIRLHEQQEHQNAMLAHQETIEWQLAAIREEIRRLQRVCSVVVYPK